MIPSKFQWFKNKKYKKQEQALRFLTIMLSMNVNWTQKSKVRKPQAE